MCLFRKKEKKMKIKKALNKIKPLVGKKFGSVFSSTQLNGIITNKGKTGQILEMIIGLKLSNTTLDFADGELKSNKCDNLGKPLETMFITQISGIIDELFEKKNYKTSKLYKKTSHILYVPICKIGNPQDWYIVDAFIVKKNRKYKKIYKQLEKDYYDVCKQLINNVDTSGMIHTSSGEYLQVRSKDLKPYHPIYSNKYGKYISNKNHAFYFKKEFMKAIMDIKH